MTRIDVPIRLVLVSAPAGVDFAIQRGRGVEFTPELVQRGTGGDLIFDFPLTVASLAGRVPNFVGPFAQGPASARFVYVDVGTYAGQQGTPWSRRIKVPLQDVSLALVRKVLEQRGRRLMVRVAGAGKDGSPACATVRPLGPWRIA